MIQLDIEGERYAKRTDGWPFGRLPRNHFGRIAADPPWTFATRSPKGKGRSAEQHYGCMSLDEIKALPVAELAAPDCALFLWVTDPHLALGLDIMAGWGFTYKTVAFTWAKLNMRADPDLLSDQSFFTGMGYWTRANPEMCLLGTRGSPQRLDKSVRQLIVTPRREHSRKPDEAYKRMERLVEGPGLEMFARTRRPGWHSWGNETAKFVPAEQGFATNAA